MELSEKDKNAIENLIILSRYALENSAYVQERDLAIARKSIKSCERIIGRKIEEGAEVEIAGMTIDKFAALVKKRK